MNSVIFNECLVYLPHLGNIPQRMRLRLRPNLTTDDLLFQIDRQCAEFTTTPLDSLCSDDQKNSCASSLKPCMLTSKNFTVFVLSEHEHALLPIECVNDEVLRTCTTLLVKRKPLSDSAEVTDSVCTNINNTSTNINSTDKVKEAETKYLDNLSLLEEEHEQEQSAQVADQTPEQNTLSACKENEHHGSATYISTCALPESPEPSDNLTWETTKMMLSIVERICTNYALEVSTNSKLQIISEVEWQSLLRYAMSKANKEFDLERVEMGVDDVADGVDYRVLRAFKRAIVGSMANAQRFRVSNDTNNDELCKN